MQRIDRPPGFAAVAGEEEHDELRRVIGVEMAEKNVPGPSRIQSAEQG
jgi:hypothetical protein